MINLDKYQASKKAPVQQRSKETVRLILLAAAELFSEQGVSSITTNDIADRAGIPIGSVYSYFDDKEAILISLSELYYTEVIAIFDQLSTNPLLPHMSRFEVATIIINIWSYYLENNHPLNYVQHLRIEPALYPIALKQQARLQKAFCRMLHAKSPERKHNSCPGSPCNLILQQGRAIAEGAEFLYRNDHASRQEFVDQAIPPYCAFIESLK